MVIVGTSVGACVVNVRTREVVAAIGSDSMLRGHTDGLLSSMISQMRSCVEGDVATIMASAGSSTFVMKLKTKTNSNHHEAPLTMVAKSQAKCGSMFDKMQSKCDSMALTNKQNFSLSVPNLNQRKKKIKSSGYGKLHQTKMFQPTTNYSKTNSLNRRHHAKSEKSSETHDGKALCLRQLCVLSSIHI